MDSVLYDAAGHRRSPATMPGYHQGRPRRNKGLRYPADPPTVEEIVALMRAAGDRREGARLRALIVILWRAGLRISEALARSAGRRRRSAPLSAKGRGDLSACEMRAPASKQERDMLVATRLLLLNSGSDGNAAAPPRERLKRGWPPPG
jgi:hypothetical protein